jgi:hypothetical protein
MVWAIVLLLILLIPLTMQFTNEVQWNEAIAYSIILVAVGGIYELWQWLKRQKITYQSALIIGLMTALFIGWVNGAVGIIGSENNSANLLYGTVFIVGLIGSIISRFKPLGMARTLFVAALVQLLIPVFALYIWPAKTSWGEAGVIGVFVINSIFAILFVVSAMLFRRAGKIEN